MVVKMRLKEDSYAAPAQDKPSAPKAALAKARNILRQPEWTSKRIASLAAKGVRKPESLNLIEIRAICASALAQTEGGIDQLDGLKPGGG
jgi:hypothetical protein